MFCVQCGEEIAAAGRFCPACGEPTTREAGARGVAAGGATRTRPSGNARLSPATRARASGLAGLSPLAFLVALVCFVLPFVEVSCLGLKKDLSGLDLVVGVTVEGQRAPGDPLVQFALLTAFIGIIAGLAARTENDWASRIGAVSGAVLGLAGGVALLLFVPLLRHRARLELGTQGGLPIEIRFLPAFWVTVLLLAGAGVALASSVRLTRRTGYVVLAAVLVLAVSGGFCALWGGARPVPAPAKPAPRAARPKVVPGRPAAAPTPAVPAPAPGNPAVNAATPYGSAQQRVIARLDEAARVQQRIYGATRSYSCEIACIQQPERCFGLAGGADLTMGDSGYSLLMFPLRDGGACSGYALQATAGADGPHFCVDARGTVCESEEQPAAEGECACLRSVGN